MFPLCDYEIQGPPEHSLHLIYLADPALEVLPDEDDPTQKLLLPKLQELQQNRQTTEERGWGL